ncbi:DinB family protein [Nocardioides pelophilus]|uniref:DinB family protein n=1 Tax=Nocardioides pelophilus TaxID=2172019 RepID=UPI001603E6E3|nr:DinB family protein [Nocardioides pelophilus]
MSSDLPDTTAPERKTLVDLLADNRAEILGLLDGLTEEEARRSLVPSLTTLLGLVKHAAFAEQVWFHVTLTGRTRAEVGVPSDIDDSFRLAPDDTIASISDNFRRVCQESDRVAFDHDLDDTGTHHRFGPVSLRWMYVHMIEELARHAGHGDILREQVVAAREG